VTVQTQVGGALPLGCSATGKAILAYQDEQTIKKVARALEAFTKHTLVPAEKLFKDLELTRRRGFSINRGERHLSVSGVAAAIRDRNGKVEAAIGISGPSDRFPLELMLQHGEVLKALADDLSEEMGWSSDRVEVVTPDPVAKRAKAGETALQRS
jgi:DNA-binding IclR family transcriptional regulator